MIELRSIGAAEIHTGSATITPSQEIVFAAALYLILERGKPVSRVRLASMLWPRAPEKTRAHRLRQTLVQLRKHGFIVDADRDKLRVPGKHTLTDIERFADNASERLRQTTSLEFLLGYSPRMSENL